MDLQSNEKTILEDIFDFFRPFFANRTLVLRTGLVILLFLLNLLDFFCISVISIKIYSIPSEKFLSLYTEKNISNSGINILTVQKILGFSFCFVILGLIAFLIHIITRKLVKYFSATYSKLYNFFSLAFPVFIVIASSLFLFLSNNEINGLCIAFTMYGYIFYLFINELSFDVRI